MTVAPFDLVLLALIVLMAVRVTIIGFIDEFFSKAAVIVGVIAAILFHRAFADILRNITGEQVFTGIAAFLILFIAVYLAFKIMQYLVGTAFEGESMSSLDRALGFFLGTAEGLLLSMAVLVLLRMQPWIDPAPILERSVFARLFDPFLSETVRTFPKLLPIGAPAGT